MDKLFARRFPFLPLFLLIISFLFSGCAEKNPSRQSGLVAPTGAETKTAVIPPAVTNESGPDDLEMSDSEICLDKELEALVHSGQWGSPVSAVPQLEQALEKNKYDFPVVVNNQVLAYMELFQNDQREMFQHWLARSTKYLPVIHEELRKEGLPLDLAYLSMIESGFNPKACSSAKAVGLWQFMQDTGKQYSLRINEYIDERRHVEKSTRAAVNFLADLYRDFGDWHLAVAAYNGGPARVQTGLDRFQKQSFWDLASEQYLPLETKRYVPKLIAAIIIAKDPEKFGFTSIPYQKELQFEMLPVSPGLGLEAVALVTGSDLPTIKNLNPELRQDKVPPHLGRYAVRIPAGSKELASKNLPSLRVVQTTKYKNHQVGSKEDIADICKKYAISTTTLLKANNLRSNKLVPGKTLLIPYSTAQYTLKPPSKEEMIAATSSNDKTKVHSVKKGETLGAIARKYAVTARQLQAWNDLINDSTIKAGQQLIVASVDGTAGDSPVPPVVTVSKEKSATPITIARKQVEKVGKPSIIEAASQKMRPEKNAHAATWYQVKNGESLWTIAQKHNVSPDQIKKWNNLKSHHLQVGKQLRVSEA